MYANRTEGNNMYKNARLPIYGIAICTSLFLGACTPVDQDMPHELKDLTSKIKGKIEPLPKFSPYMPTDYTVSELPDPFGPQKALLAGKTEKSELSKPDLNRFRQPLEAFPLEALQFSGTIIQRNTVHALISAEDNLYTVSLGDYMGQNYGRIIKISESELVLVEKIQEPSGDWVERENIVPLSGAR